ncbi:MULTISPECIES: hypothetical protein [unclassified Streptomyces]|uniref:hypothetical protein n=1 Tax=unclassified Streptomyces TaxID=2593676 RepID=UPI0033F0B582
MPRQLPPDVPLFVGRNEQLESLDGLLAAGATTAVAAVGGGPGVGKTSPAVHWAHRVRDHFPDGQLYVPLRRCGPDGPALYPAEAAAGVLEAFGVPGAAGPGWSAWSPPRAPGPSPWTRCRPARPARPGSSWPAASERPG